MIKTGSKSIRNKSYIIFTVSFIIFGVVVALLASFINYRLEYTKIDQELLMRVESEKLVKLESLANSMTSFDHLIQALAFNPLTQNYIEDSTSTTLSNVQNLFVAAAESNPLIMQIRFLDKRGMETIRVDRSKDRKRVFVVSERSLQDKHLRYYFIETSQLLPHQFWHSRLDLNREKGELERPLRPTFRVATPVFNGKNFLGVVIVNIEAEQLINVLTRSSNFNIMIIDGEGEFVFHDNPDYVWSRYLDNHNNFIDLFPVIGPKIIHQSDGKFDDFYSFSIASQFNNGENLRIILHPKIEIFSKLTMNHLFAALLVAVVIIFVSFPLSWLAAMMPLRLQSKLHDTLTDLQRSNEVLDKNVMSSTSDLRGNIIGASSAFCRVSGYKLSELQGQKRALLRHPDTLKETHKNLWQTIQSGHIWRGEMRNRKKSGEGYWIKIVITPHFDVEGNIINYTEISQDITAQKEIEILSITDALTQLYNRRKIDQILEQEMDLFNRHQQNFSVILLDLDHFKQVNDIYGHQVGDHVLTETAACLSTHTRKIDYTGRWGGEEFLIILTGTDAFGAGVIAEKLRSVINQHDFHPVKQLSASFGVAQCQEDESIIKLISRVDSALYKAKDEGRNRVSISSIS